LSVVPTIAQKKGIFTTAVADPRTGATYTTMPDNLKDPIALQVLSHYPDPNVSGTSNYSRTAVEPDRQDQFDARIDRNFGSNPRIFGRYSYFRDDDTPVTPLPDGSGSITSGVTGHAITRGDSIAAAHEWTLSEGMLNQARFRYTRRDLHQTSLQNGGITVPGLPQNSFPSVLPIFSLAGFAQIGPTSGANSNFTTSVIEFLDTFSLLRALALGAAAINWKISDVMAISVPGADVK
jgi:hypothetical protein